MIFDKLGQRDEIESFNRSSSRSAVLQHVTRYFCILILLLSVTNVIGAELVIAPTNQSDGQVVGATPNGDSINQREAAIVPPQRPGAIYFAKDSSELGADALQILFDHATELKDDRKRTIALTGYLDAVHIASLDLAVVNQRIENITDVLEKFGVSTRQISNRIHYDINTTSPCVTEICRGSYRRVEMQISVPPSKKQRSR
jgi:outer membrane protein OmpA-like peptidoglycan-associated protein